MSTKTIDQFKFKKFTTQRSTIAKILYRLINEYHKCFLAYFIITRYENVFIYRIMPT